MSHTHHVQTIFRRSFALLEGKLVRVNVKKSASLIS